MINSLHDVSQTILPGKHRARIMRLPKYGQIIGCYGFSYCSTISPLKQGHLMHFYLRESVALGTRCWSFQGFIESINCFYFYPIYNPCQEGRDIATCKEWMQTCQLFPCRYNYHLSLWLLESLILMPFSTLESQLNF